MAPERRVHLAATSFTTTAQRRPGFVLAAWARVPVRIAYAQLAVVFAMLASLPLVKSTDPDFWWHLRTGRLIVDSGLPRTDPYSWTAGGEEWVLHEWLSEVLIYGVEAALGYSANALLFGALTALALAIAFAHGQRTGASSRALVLLTLLAAVMMARFVTVRPQVFTWVLLAFFVYLLARRDAGDRAPLWLLPPLTALWANLHLGFVYGLMAIALWIAAVAFERIRGANVDLRMPLAIGAACVAASCVNPSGPEILLYPLRYLEDREALTIVSEWRRPDFTRPLTAPYLLALVLLAASLLVKERPRPFLILLTVAVIALSLQAARNLPFLALLLAPVVGGTFGRRWSGGDVSSEATAARVPRFVVAGLGGVFLALMAVVAADVRDASWRAPREDGFPAEAVPYLRGSGPEVRLYNEYTWGGYLIEKLYPEAPLFIDGRTDLYRGRLIRDYVTIGRLEPGWEQLLESYGINTVLVRKDARLADELRSRSGWMEVVTGEVEAVFTRTP